MPYKYVKYELFVPTGGYRDIHEYYDTLEEAQKSIKRNGFKYYSITKQECTVIEDKIGLYKGAEMVDRTSN